MLFRIEPRTEAPERRLAFLALRRVLAVRVAVPQFLRRRGANVLHGALEPDALARERVVAVDHDPVLGARR